MQQQDSARSEDGSAQAAERSRQAAQRAARQAKKEARRLSRGAGQQQRRAQQQAATARPDHAEFLYCSCVGQLGSFGNHILQFAFARALSDVHGLKLVCPPWLGQRVFTGGGADSPHCSSTVGERAARVLLADKMVVGHADWREWACGYEPLRGIVQAEGLEAVTGRRAKREVPQVNGSCISTQAPPPNFLADGWLHDSAAVATVVELAGAIQFAPSVFESHRDRLREVFALQPALQAVVKRVQTELRRGASGGLSLSDGEQCVVAVNLGSLHPGSASVAADTPVDWWSKAPPDPDEKAAEGWPYRTAHEWCDESATWDAPAAWLVEWLDASWEQLSVEGNPVLVLCADGVADAQDNRAAFDTLQTELLRFCPQTVSQIMGERDSTLWAAAREAVADTLTDEALLAVIEWAVQAAAEVLVVSNSTFSFSAAWVSSAAAAPQGKPEPEPEAEAEAEAESGVGDQTSGSSGSATLQGSDDMEFPRLWRADPTAARYVTFDPWCTDPLIEAARAPPTDRSRPAVGQQQQQELLAAKDRKRRAGGDTAWLEATDLMHSLYTPPRCDTTTGGDDDDDIDGGTGVGSSSQAPKSLKLEATLRSLAVPPLDTSIRLNALKTDRDSLIRELQQAGVPALETAPLYDVVPDLIVVPGTGPHQINLEHPVICLDRRCGEAVMTGADVFAPGVKGIALNIRKGDLVSLVVDIDNVTLKGQPLPSLPAAAAAAASSSSHGDVSGGSDGDGDGDFLAGRWRHIGNGICMMDRIDMIASGARGVAVKMQKTEFSRPAMHGILDHLLMVQSLPSLLVSHILAPQPGERVLDMCASPGGKTTHVATLMQNKGLLVALDRTQSKIDDIYQLATRLGLHPGGCIQAQPMDCRKLMLMEPAATEPVQLPDGRMRYPGEYFDRILLDPSCSALGLRPRLLHTASAADLAGYAKLQRLLLRWAVKLLKPGGTLVFSTCTMNPLENEYNVLFCLETFPLELVPQAPFHVADPGLPIPGLSAESCANVQRFEPGSADIDTMGFFVAKFRKTASYEDDFT
jgi:16S rRNA C967 or C1407 C5-methylase (RsmB/RsmF family)